jgi:hypothetical protein
MKNPKQIAWPVQPISQRPRRDPPSTADDMMQTIHITLTDGRKGIFVGRPLVDEKDVGRCGIADIAFGPIMKMQPGMSWEPL